MCEKSHSIFRKSKSNRKTYDWIYSKISCAKVRKFHGCDNTSKLLKCHTFTEVHRSIHIDFVHIVQYWVGFCSHHVHRHTVTIFRFTKLRSSSQKYLRFCWIAKYITKLLIRSPIGFEFRGISENTWKYHLNSVSALLYWKWWTRIFVVHNLEI